MGKVLSLIFFLFLNLALGFYSVLVIFNNQVPYQEPTGSLYEVFGFDYSDALTTHEGDNLLVLVNKKVALPRNYVPSGLVNLQGNFLTFNNNLKLRQEADKALAEMVDQASKEGIRVGVVSAYRSFADQLEIFNEWESLNGKEMAETFSAHAGHSQHQLGTAVDLSTTSGPNLSYSFGRTIEGIWLANNSYKWGYVLSYPSGKEVITGYSYEPWHFRYIGVAAARKMTGLGVTLEEYLLQFGTW